MIEHGLGQIFEYLDLDRSGDVTLLEADRAMGFPPPAEPGPSLSQSGRVDNNGPGPLVGPQRDPWEKTEQLRELKGLFDEAWRPPNPANPNPNLNPNPNPNLNPNAFHPGCSLTAAMSPKGVLSEDEFAAEKKKILAAATASSA